MNRPSQPFSVAALKAGDRAEFSRLVEAFSAKLYRLALKMLADPHEAEDVLQETFLKAYRHIGGFEERANIATWLYRIASNEALMRLRRRHPETISLDEPLGSDDDEIGPPQISDWCCLPEAELTSAEARQHIRQAVQKLSPALRMVFVLRDVEGLSTQETAESLGLSEEAVKTRLSRARFQLREELSAYFGKKLEKSSYGA